MPEKCTDNPRDCPMSARIEALERANEQHGKSHRNIYDRLGKLETTTAVQEEKLDTIGEKLDDIQADSKIILQKVETLEAKPARRWESMVEKAIWAVCAAVIAWFLARMGL